MGLLPPKTRLVRFLVVFFGWPLGFGLAGRAWDLPKTRFSDGFGLSRLAITHRGLHPERNGEPELVLVAV